MFNDMKQIPVNYRRIGEKFSASRSPYFDIGVIARMMIHDVYASFDHDEFSAEVWYDKHRELWFGNVWQFNEQKETVSAIVPGELRQLIMNKYCTSCN